MPASLRHRLIFQLDGIRARALEDAHRVPDVQRVAKTSIRVDEHRNFHGLADRRGVLCDFGQADKPQIGHAPKSICYASAADVNRFKPEILDDARGERIGRAGHQQPAAFLQLGAQDFSRVGIQGAPHDVSF